MKHATLAAVEVAVRSAAVVVLVVSW